MDAHHLLSAPCRGVGKKASDEYTVPLCPDHHRELHGMGDEGLFFAQYGVDPWAWMEANNEDP